MSPDATPVYRFGDLLALARQSWVRAMARELAAAGFDDYRSTDAAALRLLLGGPVPVGRLAGLFGVSRQAARKVAAGLEARGLATTGPDPHDARRVLVALTPTGTAYGRAVTAAVASLNQRLADRVDPVELAAADAVLRAAIDDETTGLRARQVPPP